MQENIVKIKAAVLLTRTAVLKVLKETGMSKYRLAKELGIQPIMINNYLKKTRMGKVTAERFELIFNIRIKDVYDPIKILEDE